MDAVPTTALKDLYEVGEIPPLGHVPPKMHAWAIRRERHGEPEQAMQLEVVGIPEIDSQEVLVLVMAAGVNYNGVWAGLGQPVSPFDIHGAEYHIVGYAGVVVTKVDFSGSPKKLWVQPAFLVSDRVTAADADSASVVEGVYLPPKLVIP